MTPVIRIDDEVMDALNKRAIHLGNAFVTPNDILRGVLELDVNAKALAKQVVEPKPSPAPIVPARLVVLQQHPPPKSVDGKTLAHSINAFAESHVPRIKYEGMHTAIDVLTACQSLDREDYDFHYDIIAYKGDGVYIQRKPGRGYRTSAEETKTMMRQAGFTFAPKKTRTMQR